MIFDFKLLRWLMFKLVLKTHFESEKCFQINASDQISFLNFYVEEFA